MTIDIKNIIEKDKQLQHKRKNIKELFTDYNEDYTPIEIDWGKKEGSELW